jgi:diacylglycerol kinase (ATP)
MKHLKGLFHGDGDKEKVDSPKNLDHFKVGKAPHNLGPLIVFVNPKSGGNQGHQVKKDMLELLGPEQVFDLTEGGPEPGLRKYVKDGQFVPCRVLACGGDGTPGWILTVMDTMKCGNEPPIAVLPLGTGNDISRVLGWGPGYKGEPMSEVMRGLYTAHVVPFDRWSCRVGDTEGRPLNNYFSMGVDTDILLRFHEARQKNPEKFNNREMNKMHYIKFSMSEFVDDVKGRNTPLPQCCTVWADGKAQALPQEALGLMVLNIQSYGGGAKMWQSPSDMLPQSFSDEMLEIGYVKGTKHMAEIQSGLSHAIPICQCKHLKISVTEDLAMQVDGEPWLQKVPPSSVGIDVEISHLKQNRMMQHVDSKIR